MYRLTATWLGEVQRWVQHMDTITAQMTQGLNHAVDFDLITQTSCDGMQFASLRSLQDKLRQRGAAIPDVAAWQTPQREFVSQRRALTTLYSG